jgi:hypothetical protein
MALGSSSGKILGLALLSLSVQFWDIYCVCNEPLEVWDVSTLKLTFHRNFNDCLMEQWFELEQIASGISFYVILSFGLTPLVGSTPLALVTVSLVIGVLL